MKILLESALFVYVFLMVIVTSEFTETETQVRVPEVQPKGSISVEEPVKVSRKFEKGFNSTSVMEGNEVDLYCDLSRGGNVTRYKVVWRISDVYIDPNSDQLNTTQYSYTETPKLTQIRIKSATLDHRGWYQCALWDSTENDTFDPKYIVSYFEIRLRVKAKWAWVYPVGITVIELIVLTVFLVIVLNFNLLNPDGLEEDDNEPEPDNRSHKHHVD